jgi:hypothetical protein
MPTREGPRSPRRGTPAATNRGVPLRASQAQNTASPVPPPGRFLTSSPNSPAAASKALAGLGMRVWRDDCQECWRGRILWQAEISGMSIQTLAIKRIRWNRFNFIQAMSDRFDYTQPTGSSRKQRTNGGLVEWGGNLPAVLFNTGFAIVAVGTLRHAQSECQACQTRRQAADSRRATTKIEETAGR